MKKLSFYLLLTVTLFIGSTLNCSEKDEKEGKETKEKNEGFFEVSVVIDDQAKRSYQLYLIALNEKPPKYYTEILDDYSNFRAEAWKELKKTLSDENENVKRYLEEMIYSDHFRKQTIDAVKNNQGMVTNNMKTAVSLFEEFEKKSGLKEKRERKSEELKQFQQFIENTAEKALEYQFPKRIYAGQSAHLRLPAGLGKFFIITTFDLVTSADPEKMNFLVGVTNTGYYELSQPFKIQSDYRYTIQLKEAKFNYAQYKLISEEPLSLQATQERIQDMKNFEYQKGLKK